MDADEMGINARYASHIQLLLPQALDSSFGFKGHRLGVPFLAPIPLIQTCTATPVEYPLSHPAILIWLCAHLSSGQGSHPREDR
jgi:hypothetical protein